MRSTKLTDKYPELIRLCRKWDYSYEEAIERIENERKGYSLKRWV